MQYDLKDIATRVKNGQEVSHAEYAYLLANDRDAFFAFLIANNPASMNDILRHRLGYTHELGFKPNIQAIQRICQQILDRNNAQEIATIRDNFMLNKSKISPQLLYYLKQVFN